MSKKEPKEKREMDIIQAAVDIFIEKGFNNASMNEIAERAGVSKGGLYHHFKSKDMVLLYANQRLLEPIGELMKQALGNPSAKEGIKLYIRQYVKYWIDHKREYLFFAQSMNKALIYTDIIALYEDYTFQYIHFFEALYQKGIGQGEFAVHDFKSTAITLMAALDGIITYLFLDKTMKLEEICDNFEKIFINKFILK